MARAMEMASEGVDPATILCRDSANFLDCAVILHPDMAFSQARLMLYVGMLGLGDAIGSVVPAGIDTTYLWPNRIEANVGLVAQVSLGAPPDIAASSVPSWLTLRVLVAVAGPLPEGRTGDGFETTLMEEGAAELTTIRLLESFSRHFLAWTSRWQDDGFSPVRAMWLRHSAEKDQEIEISVGNRDYRGVFETIDDDGALVLRSGESVNRVTLDDIPDR